MAVGEGWTKARGSLLKMQNRQDNGEDRHRKHAQRSVFGNNDDGYVKRIDDFAADDNDDDDDYQIGSVNKPPAKEGEGNRKRIATDLLTEEEESTKAKKKPKQEHGVVAFSKIKAASIVRVKKPLDKKPSSSLKTESTAVVVSNLKAESTAVRPDVKNDESSLPSTNAAVVSLDSEAKEIEPSKASEPSTSLLLLGNYDSSSNSEDSD